MRIVGVIFVLIGFVLCLTIVGFFFGLLLILVGLVMIVMGGRRKVIITNVVNVANTPTGTVPAEQVAASMNQLPRAARAELAGPTGSEPVAPTLVVPSAVHVNEPVSAVQSYDVAKWKALVEFDEDVAAAAKQLQNHGQQYVDQLAAAYLALNDKQYLPTIVQKVLARAQQGG